MTTPIFRFAPSPNGYLHLGHALSALLNFDMAQRSGARFLLRIDDIDQTRCRPTYEAAIYQDLAWLGLKWEEPVWRQSAHLHAYRAALDRLDAMGLIYPSFESRAEIARLAAERDRAGAWPRDPDGVPLYPGNARGMPAIERRRRWDAGHPFALRLDMAAATALASRRKGSLTWSETGAKLGSDVAADSSPPPCGEGSGVGVEPVGTAVPRRTPPPPHPPPQGGRESSQLTWSETGTGPNGETGTVLADPAAWGDVILARKDVAASYHLSVVVDDAHQGVTHVVRGQDLFHATSLHRLLQHLLELPQPVYHHHRLIRDIDGRKLSKSSHATGLRELRAEGATPADIRRMIGLP
jgi:glutamyl-Q tRNA(Asp) synthetase